MSAAVLVARGSHHVPSMPSSDRGSARHHRGLGSVTNVQRAEREYARRRAAYLHAVARAGSAGGRCYEIERAHRHFLAALTRLRHLRGHRRRFSGGLHPHAEMHTSEAA